MKNKIFMLICATLLCGSIGAQKVSTDKVPAAVTTTFKSKFPSATKATWEMEGKNYEAEFKVNEVAHTASFSPTGAWLKTDTSIKIAELPSPVKETITKDFAGYTIKQANKMEDAQHGKGYEVAIEKGKESKDVVLSDKGVVMSQEPHHNETVKTD
jgi:hypothetical protein